MLGTTIIFYVVLMMPGQQKPVDYYIEVESLSACIVEAQHFTERLPKMAELKGAQIDVGCVIQLPPSEEH